MSNLGRRGRRERRGTEPVNARSALGLRLILSVIFVPLFAVAAVGFAVAASRSSTADTGPYNALAAVCAVLTVLAAIDLVVVLRRRRAGSGR